MNTNRRR